MKKILLISTILISKVLFAQEDYKTFTMELLTEKKSEYKIQLSTKDDEMFFWIEPFELDNIYDVVSLKIPENEVSKFIESINICKQKYIEWKEIAEKNGVKEIKKEIPFDYKIDKAYFNTGSSDWHYTSNVNISAYFMNFSENLSLVIKNKYKLQSRSNQFTECDGFFLVFKDVEEIDEFISILDIASAKEFISKKVKKDDLFH